MNKKIVVVILLLCAALSMGCIDEKYTEEEIKKIKTSFALDMVGLVFDMPSEPSVSNIYSSWLFTSNPTLKECEDWIYDAEKHLDEANKYKKFLFTDVGGNYDKDEYKEYIDTIKENIITVNSYKDAASEYEEMSLMLERSDNIDIESDYLIYDRDNGVITHEELLKSIKPLQVEKRKIWINVRSIVAENESGFFEKSEETLDFIIFCDEMIGLISETIDIIDDQL